MSRSIDPCAGDSRGSRASLPRDAYRRLNCSILIPLLVALVAFYVMHLHAHHRLAMAHQQLEVAYKQLGASNRQIEPVTL